MEAALTQALKAADTIEERASTTAPPRQEDGGGGEGAPALSRLNARLIEWDARLVNANQLTETIERELADRTMAVDRWRKRFAEWEKLLRSPHSTPTSS
jgi:hypothetical protein